MTPEQFCYWLQGFVELRSGQTGAGLTEKQWIVLKDHLTEVFKKQTPSYQTPVNLPPVTTPQQPQYIC